MAAGWTGLDCIESDAAMDSAIPAAQTATDIDCVEWTDAAAAAAVDDESAEIG